MDSPTALQTGNRPLQPSPVGLSPTLIQAHPPSPVDPSPPANHEQPVQVFLVVYDLLPPGKLSDLAWLLGLGLYHTAVKIPAIGREIAFGGHVHPQTSGIFSLPIPPDGKPSIPGLRWKCEIDMGHVKTVNLSPNTLDHHHHPLHFQASFSSSIHHDHDQESRRLIRPPPSAVKLIHKYRPPPSPHHQYTAYPPGSMPELKTTPIFTQPSHTSSSSTSLDSQNSSSSTSTTPTQLDTLAFILDQLARSPDWHGTSYDLLKRNCNSFSHHLCMLLTGKNAPKWINRAATLGSTLPCLVPAEWIEPPAAPTSLDQSSENYEEEEEEPVDHSPYASPTIASENQPT